MSHWVLAVVSHYGGLKLTRNKKKWYRKWPVKTTEFRESVNTEYSINLKLFYLSNLVFVKIDFIHNLVFVEVDFILIICLGFHHFCLISNRNHFLFFLKIFYIILKPPWIFLFLLIFIVMAVSVLHTLKSKSYFFVKEKKKLSKYFMVCLLQSTTVQGSKLRLPGYLSGKGFQSAEEGTLINAAVLKARTQMAGGEHNF